MPCYKAEHCLLCVHIKSYFHVLLGACSGIREVVVADVSKVAMDIMRDRQDPDKGGLSRSGLRFVHADVAVLDQAVLAAEPGATVRFDLIIDKVNWLGVLMVVSSSCMKPVNYVMYVFRLYIS